MKKNDIRDFLPIFSLFILVILNLSLMIFINWNWAHTINNYFTIDKQIDTVYKNTINSKLLLGKAIHQDPYIDVKKEVLDPLLQESFSNFIINSKKQSSFEYALILPYFIKIDVEMKKFHYLSQKRWKNFKKYGFESGELYYDSEYEDLVNLVDNTRDKIEEHLANALHEKDKYFIFSIFLFLTINLIGFIILVVYKRKKERFAINLSQEKEKAIITLHSIGDGVIATNQDGTVTLINNVAKKLIGYSEQEAVGRKLEDIFHIVQTKTDKLIKNPVRKVLEFHKTVNLSNDTVLISKDKNRYQISDSAAPILNDNGNIMGVILVFHDISKEYALKESLQLNQEKLFEANKKLMEHKMRLELLVKNRTQKLENSLTKLKKMQNQIIQTEKMAALGELVAGIAHEINTPVGLSITGITNFTYETNKIHNLYKNEQMGEEDFIKYIENTMGIASILSSNLQQTAELVKSFKQISIDQTNEQKREFNLKNYLNYILLSLNSKIKNTNIKIILNCDEKITIYSYPGICSQIVTNLVINSLVHGYDYKDNGLITLDYKIAYSALHFTYTDNGKGINKENLKKIFNPFFTTKRKEGGSGLGLNIIYNLITQKLNGTIKCKSKMGQGVEFNIVIPIAREEEVNVI